LFRTLSLALADAEEIQTEMREALAERFDAMLDRVSFSRCHPAPPFPLSLSLGLKPSHMSTVPPQFTFALDVVDPDLSQIKRLAATSGIAEGA
jgi:hypothetical protein